jgi:putative membrane protein
MITAAMIFAGLAALLHVYIFVMESLTWTSARTRATFGTTQEEAETTKLLAFNQGFYNLFLAIASARWWQRQPCCSHHHRTRRAPPSRRARSP